MKSRLSLWSAALIAGAVLLACGGRGAKDPFAPYYGKWEGSTQLANRKAAVKLEILPSSAGPLGKIVIGGGARAEPALRLVDLELTDERLRFKIDGGQSSDMDVELGLQDGRLVGELRRTPAQREAPGGEPPVPGAGIRDHRQNRTEPEPAAGRGQAARPRIPDQVSTLNLEKTGDTQRLDISQQSFEGLWKLASGPRAEGVSLLLIDSGPKGLSARMEIKPPRRDDIVTVELQEVAVDGAVISYLMPTANPRVRLKVELTCFGDELIGRFETGKDDRLQSVRYERQ